LRRFNAFALRIAGTRYWPLNGVVLHRGRRSGRAYATPVIVRPTREGFVVPLHAGERADWVQNLRAAGGGVIRWKGREYPVADPLVIGRAAARPLLGWLTRALAPLIGFQRLLYVRVGAARSEDPVVVAHKSE
jgi:deazaflavin-dependent oxidoreductase (nitroreductase family)